MSHTQKVMAEYIWIDGATPTARLRSKTKVIDHPIRYFEDIPVWGFDGSSTGQATGHHSDCMLQPVYFVPDPIRGGSNVLVMCEVLNPDGTPHATNARAKLRVLADKYKHTEAWFGMEQEYTFFEGARPLGWPDKGFPAPQFGYYCGVGADEVFGREIVERHMQACIDAGLMISGINAEVMPGQWEFQIGPVEAPYIGDQMWLARWLLYRIAEDFGVSATLDPKPVKGDWNGAGMHTNFSTKEMREEGGLVAIERTMEYLARRHNEHIDAYGHGNEHRMLGTHETADINKFTYGVSDRGASVRIPMATNNDRKGYFEDRRPAANADPYRVATVLLETVGESSAVIPQLSPMTQSSDSPYLGA